VSAPKSSHTPGPWKRVDRRESSKDVYIEGANGAEVIVGYDYEGLHMDDADIDRAVACVNACEGRDPAKLRADHDAIVPEVLALRERSAELLEALTATLDRYVSFVNSGDGGHWDPESERHVIAARAAIAKVQP
jgi:hypothetical protein